MSFGLQIQSASGFVQVDADYSNYTRFSSGTIAARPFEYDPSAGVTVNGCGKLAIVMVRAPIGARIHGAVDNRSVPDGLRFSVFSLGAATTVSYRIYSLVDRFVPSDPYGLQVFDASGRRVFDSAAEYLRATHNVTLAANTDSSGVLVPADASSFAMLGSLTPMGIADVGVGEGSELWTLTAEWQSGGILFAPDAYFFNGPYVGYTYFYGGHRSLLISKA